MLKKIPIMAFAVMTAMSPIASYAASGEITDGSVADLYGNNSNCSWLISPPGATSITLEFSEFFTEYGHDSVIVYNGVTLYGDFYRSGVSILRILRLAQQEGKC